jgi:predicted dehydrogenase
MIRLAIKGPGFDSLPNESNANLLAELAIANRTYIEATAVAQRRILKARRFAQEYECEWSSPSGSVFENDAILSAVDDSTPILLLPPLGG